MTKNDKVVVEEDDDDDIESVKGPTRSSPFHLLGAFCFILAIIAGVVCCLVSTLISDITPKTRGIIFFTTFVTFIILLFFCLCCTYYLGASREAWETPTFTGVRWNFTNIVAMAGLFVEFVQICSFGFNQQFGSYYGSTFFEYFKHVATPYSKGEYFEVAYWVMFVVAFSPYIFVIAIRIMIYMYGIRRGADSAASVVERYQDNIYSILWFLVNTLYFPVITMMLAGTSCTFSNTSTDGSNIPPTLDANNSIICLQGKHIGFLVCTMIALIIYYPAASFAQSQTQNISDIKFKPKVVFVMLQGKFVMGAICVAFANNKYWAYISTAVVINFFFLILNIVFQPCLLRWVNRLRTVFFALSFWSTIVLAITNILYYDKTTGKMKKGDSSKEMPLIILLVGWGIIIVFFTGFFLGYRHLFNQLRAKFRNNAGDKSSSQVNSPQGASQNEQELDEIPSIHQPQYNNNNSKTTSNQSTPPPPATTTTTINSNNNISEDSSSSDES